MVRFYNIGRKKVSDLKDNFIKTLYYLAKGKVQQVIKPERRWGPGDKEVRQQILEEMTHGQIPRVGAYAYENNGMAYEAYHM